MLPLVNLNQGPPPRASLVACVIYASSFCVPVSKYYGSGLRAILRGAKSLTHPSSLCPLPTWTHLPFRNVPTALQSLEGMSSSRSSLPLITFFRRTLKWPSMFKSRVVLKEQLLTTIFVIIRKKTLCKTIYLNILNIMEPQVWP